MPWIDPTSGGTKSSSRQWFLWWRDDDSTDHYSVRAPMRGIGAALLVDTCSPDNLCGDAFTKRVTEINLQAGRKPPEHVEIPRFASEV